MARKRPDLYSTIEYIGPRPQKPKRQSNLGGWVIVMIAIAAGIYFGKPLLPFLKAAQTVPSEERAHILISSLENGGFNDRLAAAALDHSTAQVQYDPAYFIIDYPNGDVPPNKGVAADVLIRCYRKLGIDLQVEVHEDIKENFRLYPQLWSASAPDTNIDHRRVLNLRRFFSRHGEVLQASRNATDYQPGDIVVWSLGRDEFHIGLVVPGPGDRSSEPWVVHNMGAGVKWENCLFDYQPLDHFRYSGEAAKHVASQ